MLNVNGDDVNRLLVIHKRKHLNTSEVTGLTCAECGKVLSTAGALRLHTMRHTGERPYSCKLCERTYISNHSLENHLATCHLGKVNLDADGEVVPTGYCKRLFVTGYCYPVICYWVLLPVIC